MYNKFLVLFFIVFITGCSAANTKISQVQQNFIKSFRDPGDKKVASAKDTLKTYKCKKQELYIDHIEVLPEIAVSGKEINQRIRYAFCSPDISQDIDGEIVRSISHKGNKQFVDVTKYSFKPGIWNVDVFIEIPKGAEEGEYELGVVLKYGSELIKKTVEFFVEVETKE